MVQGPLSYSKPSFDNKSHSLQPSTPLHETPRNDFSRLPCKADDRMLNRPSEIWVKTRIFPYLNFTPTEPAHHSLPLRVDREMPTVTAPSCRKRDVLFNCWPGGFLTIRLRAAGFALGLRCNKSLGSELLVRYVKCLRHVLKDKIGVDDYSIGNLEEHWPPCVK